MPELEIIHVGGDGKAKNVTEETLLEICRPFIPKRQLQNITGLCKGEEGDHWRGILQEIATTIETMPATGDTDGQGDEAIVHLHYFLGACDWWILEKDMGDADDDPPGLQHQAFGFVCLGDWDCAELGYISIPEFDTITGPFTVELDCHWTPVTLGEIKNKRPA